MMALEGEAGRWFWRKYQIGARLHHRPGIFGPLFGAIAIASAAAGLLAFTTAVPAKPVAVDGVVESAGSPDASSKYPGIDVRLAGDPTAYRLEVTEFASVPDAAALDGQPVTLWVDDGTTHVLAIRLANQTFKSSWMDNPKAKLEGNYVAAAALGVVALFFMWAIWWVIPHKRPALPE